METTHYAKSGQPSICGDTDGRTRQRADLITCPMCKELRPKRETPEIIAGIQRQIRALEERCIDDPANLAAVILLAQQLSEVVNVSIAANMAKRAAAPAAERPYVAPSGNELAALLGVKPQSITDRRKLGDRVLFERAVGEGTMAQRDRLARTRAQQHAERELSEFLGRRESIEG